MSRALRLLGVCGLVAWCGATLERGTAGGVALEQEGDAARLELVPRHATAERQLAHATELKQRRIGASDDARSYWARRAVAAYRAVRAFHPKDAARGAEAAFRAGALLAAEGDLEGARREYEIAVELGRGTAFRARGGLEIGHLHRREARLRDALARYLAVAADDAAASDHRDDAWLHAARTWHALGDRDDATAAYERVARHALDPRTRVLAFDGLGMLLVERDALEDAADVLHECMMQLRDVASERTENGARTRRAIARMRLVVELPKRVEERWSRRRAEESRKKDS